MKILNRILPIFFLLVRAASATTISFAGSDLTTGGAWRTSSVSKTLDADGNNIYGSDGYFLATSPGGAVLSSPSFVTGFLNLGQSFYNGAAASPQYSLIDNPTAAGTRMTGVWYQNSANLTEDDLLRFTLSQNASFRLGVLVDTSGQVDVSPSSLRLRQTAGGTANSGLQTSNLAANLVADWYFFDVSGTSGDQFVLSGINWYNGGAAQFSNGVAGLTFDTLSVPEPGTLGMMGFVLAGLVARKYRRG